MNKYFLPYPLALLLKEKGKFNEPCLAWWNEDEQWLEEIGDICRNDDDWLDTGKGNCTAPLYDQVIDWFQEQGIYIETDNYGTEHFEWVLKTDEEHNSPRTYLTRQLALNAAIEYAITLLP